MTHENCWAKTNGNLPGVNVIQHCINVGVMAEALLENTSKKLLERLQITPQIGKMMVSMCACHDVGKVCPGFQAKCDEWIKKYDLEDIAQKEGWKDENLFEKDHSVVGQITIQDLLIPKARIWSWGMGGHHGFLHDKNVGPTSIKHHSTNSPKNGRSWEDERVKLAKELISIFGQLPDFRPTDALLWHFSGLLTTADWLASDENHFPPMFDWSEVTDRKMYPKNVTNYKDWTLDLRRDQAREIIKKIQWNSESIPANLSFEQLFDGKHPRPLQQLVIEKITKPGLYIIEDSTGGGKTEIALQIAYKLISQGDARGIFFALPTQFTGNQIYDRVKEFLSKLIPNPDVRLAHSASWIKDYVPEVQDVPEIQERAPYSWFASSKRALLAPYGVGTVDQALMGVISVKHFFLRQYALINKVVILDEIHSYDLYTSTLIKSLVTRLIENGCTVIILSATLTKKKRAELLRITKDEPLPNEYPLISSVVNGEYSTFSLSKQKSKRKVKISLCREAESMEEAIRRAKAGQCVMIVRNTVELAQETYKMLRSRLPESTPVGLLHARMPSFIREPLQKEWAEKLGAPKPGQKTKRPKGCILVGTQVVEQSLDIDVDFLISDLAPIDMILQRIGRLWRHLRPDRKGSPEAMIIQPSEDLSKDGIEISTVLEPHSYVYDPYVLASTERTLRGVTFITENGRDLLELTYERQDLDSSSFSILRNKMLEAQKKLETKAINAQCVGRVKLQDDLKETTRYESQACSDVVLLKSMKKNDDGTYTIVGLDGQSAIVNDPIRGRRKDRWKKNIAALLQVNKIRCPDWHLKYSPDAPEWLHDYFFSSSNIAIVQESGETSIPGMTWNQSLGVILSKIT